MKGQSRLNGAGKVLTNGGLAGNRAPSPRRTSAATRGDASCLTCLATVVYVGGKAMDLLSGNAHVCIVPPLSGGDAWEE